MADDSNRLLGALQNDADVQCTSLERSLRFFRDVLGLDVVHETAESVRLDGGEGRWLTLWRAHPLDEAGLSMVGRHTGATFAVDDLMRVFEDLQSEGVQFVSRPCSQPSGQIMVNFADPDENVLTLVQYRQTVRDWRASARAGDSGTVAA